MKPEILKLIINQIKRYNLTNSFEDKEQFENWLFELNTNQINNFLSLDVNPTEIKFEPEILINKDLLNCEDYNKRVAAIMSLKNGKGCWHLFRTLCKPNFLKSDKFYKDIEMLSKADTARYGLWILGEDSFINSPYHDEDLKLLVETHDINEEKKLDFIVSDALATVASNLYSIKSPYHQKDMQLMAQTGSDCLQGRNSYPEDSLNNLAINKVSLKDKYHLENMKILATNPVSREFLYKIMTNPEIVTGKNYRKEVETLINAKSKHTARAIYYYITNPNNKFGNDYSSHDESHNNSDIRIYNSNFVSGKKDPDYLKNLESINMISDEFVMHYVALLMTKKFINSPYKKFDLELLKSVKSKSIFIDLYKFMSLEASLYSNHHKEDAIIISQTTENYIRNLLVEKATSEHSIKSTNHEYDMKYISKLNFDTISKDIYNAMYYFLFNPKGIDAKDHIDSLEKLKEGIIVDRKTCFSDYLNELEKQISDNQINDQEIVPIGRNSETRAKTKIFSLFKKYIKKED